MPESRAEVELKCVWAFKLTLEFSRVNFCVYQKVFSLYFNLNSTSTGFLWSNFFDSFITQTTFYCLFHGLFLAFTPLTWSKKTFRAWRTRYGGKEFEIKVLHFLYNQSLNFLDIQSLYCVEKSSSFRLLDSAEFLIMNLLLGWEI